MPLTNGEIRIPEVTSGEWLPVRIQAAPFARSACTANGAGDFDLDLHLVGHKFLSRRVTPEEGAAAAPPPHPPGRAKTSRAASGQPRPRHGCSRDRSPARAHKGVTGPGEVANNPDRARERRAKKQTYKSTSSSESDRVRPELYE